MVEPDTVRTEYTHDGHVCHVVLDRPDKLNAQTLQMVSELYDVFDSIESKDVRVATLRGAGGNFSSGGDLEYISERRKKGGEALDRWRTQTKETFDKITNLSIPTVAVLEGYVFAGGLELMLTCDLAVASEDAVISDQHVNNALVGGGGSTQRLPRLLGERRAKELIMTGKRITPERAREWGLINEVYPKADFEDDLHEFLDNLASKSPEAQELAKYLVNTGRDMELDTALSVERRLAMNHSQTSDDVQEALAAFKEGRDPSF